MPCWDPYINSSYLNDKEQDILGSVDTIPLRFCIMITIILHCTWNGRLAEVCIWIWVTKRHPSWPTGRSSRHLAFTTRTWDSRYNTICIQSDTLCYFDLTPDRGASERHTSHSDKGNTRIALKFKALPDAIICLLYLEYDNCVCIDWQRTVTTDMS